MRNSRGIEIKRGHWVHLSMPKGDYEGRVVSVSARDKVLTLDDGYAYPVDAVTQTLGPMVVGPDGVVSQNPLSRVKVGSRSQRTKAAPTKRLRKRRAKTEKAPAGFYANPLVRVKVGSPSQLTGAPPSARLKKRRKATAKTKNPGVYANPAQRVVVEIKKPSYTKFAPYCTFDLPDPAMEYARALQRQHPDWTIKVRS